MHNKRNKKMWTFSIILTNWLAGIPKKRNFKIYFSLFRFEVEISSMSTSKNQLEIFVVNYFFFFLFSIYDVMTTKNNKWTLENVALFQSNDVVFSRCCFFLSFSFKIFFFRFILVVAVVVLLLFSFQEYRTMSTALIEFVCT